MGGETVNENHHQICQFLDWAHGRKPILPHVEAHTNMPIHMSVYTLHVKLSNGRCYSSHTPTTANASCQQLKNDFLNKLLLKINFKFDPYFQAFPRKMLN